MVHVTDGHPQNQLPKILPASRFSDSIYDGLQNFIIAPIDYELHFHYQIISVTYKFETHNKVKTSSFRLTRKT